MNECYLILANPNYPNSVEIFSKYLVESFITYDYLHFLNIFIVQTSYEEVDFISDLEYILVVSKNPTTVSLSSNKGLSNRIYDDSLKHYYYKYNRPSKHSEFHKLNKQLKEDKYLTNNIDNNPFDKNTIDDNVFDDSEPNNSELDNYNYIYKNNVSRNDLEDDEVDRQNIDDNLSYNPIDSYTFIYNNVDSNSSYDDLSKESLQNKNIGYDNINVVNLDNMEIDKNNLNSSKLNCHSKLNNNNLEINIKTNSDNKLKTNSDNKLKKEEEKYPQYLNYGLNKIKAQSKWNEGVTGKYINVAVLDNGIIPHKYLKVSGSVTFIPDEVPEDGISKDKTTHGTHVAGIIAAKGFDEGIVGGSYDSNIFNVKVLNREGIGDFVGLLYGLDWCGKNGMNVVNMSLGFKQPLGESELYIMTHAVNILSLEGLVLVAAAGNDNLNYVVEPARIQNVIAVGNIDIDNEKSIDSNYGERLNYVAPGVDIISTGLKNKTAIMSGTSMAAAHTSALVALLLSEDIKNGKTPRNIYDIQKILNKYALDLGSPGYDMIFGYGLSQA